jgi:hypothetical protein
VRIVASVSDGIRVQCNDAATPTGVLLSCWRSGRSPGPPEVLVEQRGDLAQRPDVIRDAGSHRRGALDSATERALPLAA